jgi:hypothetical protein
MSAWLPSPTSTTPITAPAPSTSWWAEPAVWHWGLINPRRFTRVVPLPGQRGLFKPDQLVLDMLPSLLNQAA